MIGAGLTPADTQYVNTTGCMIIPITSELQIFVNTTVTRSNTTVNTAPDIPVKIGDNTVFKNGVIPVASFVNTPPR